MDPGIVEKRIGSKCSERKSPWPSPAIQVMAKHKRGECRPIQPQRVRREALTVNFYGEIEP